MVFHISGRLAEEGLCWNKIEAETLNMGAIGKELLSYWKKKSAMICISWKEKMMIEKSIPWTLGKKIFTDRYIYL